MELSDYTLNELVKYIQGEDNITIYKSGPVLVKLFNKYGTTDLYDANNGGLPKLRTQQTMNTSRKDYTFDRLKQINKTAGLKGIIEDVVNEEGVQNLDQLVSAVNVLLVKNKYALELIGGKYEIIGAEEDEEVVEVEVSFDKIQNQILAQLDKAKFLVYVAVAWFTNDILSLVGTLN